MVEMLVHFEAEWPQLNRKESACPRKWEKRMCPKFNEFEFIADLCYICQDPYSTFDLNLTDSLHWIWLQHSPTPNLVRIFAIGCDCLQYTVRRHRCNPRILLCRKSKTTRKIWNGPQHSIRSQRWPDKLCSLCRFVALAYRKGKLPSMGLYIMW